MLLYSATSVFFLLYAANGHVEPSISPPRERVHEIAKKVADTYRSTKHLSLDAFITEIAKKPNGEVAPASEKAQAKVAMAEDGKLRLTVVDPVKRRRVLERVSDGHVVTDWNDEQRKTFPISEAGNTHIDVDFDFCYVGSLLSSWVGTESEKASLFEQRIGDGTYKGMMAIDDSPCDVVVYERRFDDGFLIRDTFYVDAKLHMLRQWTSAQVYVADTGEIASHVTRLRRYTNIRTKELPVDTFRIPEKEPR